MPGTQVNPNWKTTLTSNLVLRRSRAGLFGVFSAHSPEFVFIRGCFAFKGVRLQGETTAGSGSLCFQFALALVIYSYGNPNRARSKHSAPVDPTGKSEETLLRRR